MKKKRPKRKTLEERLHEHMVPLFKTFWLEITEDINRIIYEIRPALDIAMANAEAARKSVVESNTTIVRHLRSLEIQIKRLEQSNENQKDKKSRSKKSEEQGQEQDGEGIGYRFIAE